MAGSNWLLVGEAAGFADPILSAGMTLAHAGAREAAFLILEAERGGNVPWMAENYTRRNDRRIRQHIRFADYWYRANANFTDLKDYTSEIARDAGLELNGDQAFQWLGTGGFIEEDMEVAGLALDPPRPAPFDCGKAFRDARCRAPWTATASSCRVFPARRRVTVARFENGGVRPLTALRRDGKALPLDGLFGWMLDGLQHSPRLDVAIPYLAREDGWRRDDARPRDARTADRMLGGDGSRRMGQAQALRRRSRPFGTRCRWRPPPSTPTSPDRGDGGILD